MSARQTHAEAERLLGRLPECRAAQLAKLLHIKHNLGEGDNSNHTRTPSDGL